LRRFLGGRKLDNAPITPYWEGGTFDDSLDVPLDYPYSSVEWDSIFETFIYMLRHESYRIRQAAIAKLRVALKSESSQVSNDEDYKPKPISERMSRIFQAITSQSAIHPEIFEIFCYEFKCLIKEAPYGGLILQWLNELDVPERRQAPSYEAIQGARILLYRNLDLSPQQASNEFEIAVARIDGFLGGLSTLCHGMNYVPIYQAMVCPQSANEIAVNIQSQILVRSSDYGFYDGTECSDFQLIEHWQTALEDSLDKWIFKPLFDANLSSRKNTIAQLVRLICEAMEPEQPEVWKFQIGAGCHYHWGFDNESYAFKSKDKLFIMFFGWAD
jgi:hypothetical protein